MKSYILLFFIFFGFTNDNHSQTSPKDSLINQFVSAPHGIDRAYNAGRKAEIDKVLDNIIEYERILEKYIEDALSSQSNLETVRKAENAIYLLANSKGESGISVLEYKYNEVSNKVKLVSDNLTKSIKEQNTREKAISLRKQLNNAVLLQRCILGSYQDINIPIVQEIVLEDLPQMDFSTQLIALKYLTEVKSDKPSFEIKKYNELRNIYQDKTQFLFNSKILKKSLDKNK